MVRENSRYRGSHVANSFKKSVKRSMIRAEGPSGHPEWCEKGRGQ